MSSDTWCKFPQLAPEPPKRKHGGDSEDVRSSNNRHTKSRGREDMPVGLIRRFGWVISDSTSTHMCNSRSDFCEYTSLHCVVATADGELLALGRGKVFLEWLLPEGAVQTVTLNGVWHIPTLGTSCLSKPALQRNNTQFSSGPQGISIVLGGDQIGQALWQQGLPMLSVAFPTWRVREVAGELARARKGTAGLDTWHRRMGHLGHADVLCLMEMARGIEIAYDPNSNDCGNCTDRESSTIASHILPICTKAKLQVIHACFHGPIYPTSFSNSQYYLTLTDDFTRATWIYFLRERSQCLKALKDFKISIEAGMEHLRIERLRFAKGSEFDEQTVRVFLAEEGIRAELKPHGECVNPMLMETALCMLQSSGLPDELWAEALNAVVYLRNRSPKGVNSDNNETPFEAWYCCKPDLSHIRVFGSPVYADSLDIAPGETLVGRSVLCYLVGYQGATSRAKVVYRLWNPHTRKVVPGVDVVVDELVRRG